MTLTLGFSPCPNDCFMFDAIVHQRIDLEGLAFTILMEDVEALNRRAFAGAIDVTKLSYHALAHSVGDFALLDAGSALGRGCGPLLIAARDMTTDEVAAGGVRIAIPGQFTTANFLLSLAFPEARDKTALVFSEIEAAVVEGRFDAGVIIHENRFTYEAKGLEKVIDLGEFWERTTGAPIPLGGIAVKRSLPAEIQQAMNRVMRRSVEYAFAHPDASRGFVRAHAQEMSEAVMRQHIDLYVNEYSVDLGPDGRRAVELLFERAVAAGIVGRPNVPVFVQRAGDASPPAHDARMR
jgi:1,4-dihydroxy-6-naphthoate synthase